MIANLIVLVLLIIVLKPFYYLWQEKPCRRCVPPLSNVRIAGFLKTLENKKDFFKARNQTLVMSAKTKAAGNANEFLVFPVSAKQIICGGLCNLSRDEIFNNHHFDISFCDSEYTEILTLKFKDKGQIHSVALDTMVAHNNVYFDWSNTSCHVHANCNPEVPKDLRSVADSFIEALQAP